MSFLLTWPLCDPDWHLDDLTRIRINSPLVHAAAIVLFQVAVLSVLLIDLALAATPAPPMGLWSHTLTTIDNRPLARFMATSPLRRPVVAAEHIRQRVHDLAHGAAQPGRLQQH